MTNTKSTKRAFLSSVLALVVCIAMLVGSTFAWFTDSASTSGNTIVSGNLDVALEKNIGTETEPNWVSAEGETLKWVTTDSVENVLWEPGCTYQLPKLRIKNNGNLALKYKVIITGITGDAELLEVIKFTGLPQGQEEYVSLLPGNSNEFLIEGHMDEEAGNKYMNKTIDNISITVYATQLNYENDSYGPDYDKGLTPPDEDGDIIKEIDGALYAYNDNGSRLYKVPEDYTGTTFKVADGIEAIGDYAFYYNTNVKEVIVPSDVKSLGRGFDSSTVERVVIEEGLEKIDSRAFKATTNLQEVVIPSTVKVIEDNAFQKSGIKNIVIPATVETIEKTAFGASLVETVTFEGNTSVQAYAFRNCTQLHTVTMKGDDNTFVPSDDGINSMWFCNGESNNPNTSNITFYVQNTTVATRVKAAMGAEANNTPVYVNGQLFVTAKNVTELQNAINNGVNNTLVYLTADITGDVTIDTDKAIAIDGADHKYAGTIKIAVDETVTVKNLNFVHEGSTAYDFIKNEGSPTGKNYNTTLLVEDCTFIGDGNNGTAAVRLTHPTLVTINRCEGEGLHSFLQNTGGQKVVIDDLTVTDSKSAVSLGGVRVSSVSNCNFSVGLGYGIRIDAATADAVHTVESCKISAYIPVVVRKATASNVSLTINGTNTMTQTNTEGVWCVAAGNEYGYEDKSKAELTAAAGITVTVNDNTLDTNGVFVKK